MTKNKKAYQYRAKYINKALNEKYLYKKAVKEAWGWKEEKQCRSHKRDLLSLQIFAMKSFRNIKKHAAFSLVELLMALLVASLLLAALAPVMTRKLGENITISGIGGAIIPTSSCDYKSPGTYGENGECTMPSNIYEAGFIIASGGGGGGSSADMVSTTLSKADTVDAATSSSGSHTAKTYEFSNNTTGLRFLISGGGGGAGGVYYTTAKIEAPENQSDCEPFGIFIKGTYNGGKSVCVSKYNPGENRDGSPNITGIAEVSSVPAGSSCSKSTTGYCCWYGNNNPSYRTTNSGVCNSANGDYSGCYRTVCQWNAANAICKAWAPIAEDKNIKGRLPKKTELDAWIANFSNVSRNKGTAGLQLCSFNTSSGNSRCYHRDRTDGSNGGCPGAAATTAWYGYCNARYVWSSDTAGVNSSNQTLYECLALDDNTPINVTRDFTDAHTPRCVIDQVYKFKSYAGGGGSAGAYLSVDVPAIVLQKATQNGGKARVILSAGAGGNAGNKASGASTGSKGINGESSSVEIYSDTNELIYKIEVPGGIGGYGANASSAGNPADTLSLNDENCKFLDKISGLGKEKTELTNVKCSYITTVYNMGSIPPAKAPSEGTASTGGKNTGWGNSSLISSGGSGGVCTYEDSLSCPEHTITGKGTGGRIDVYTSVSYPGAGGGGGGAGSVAMFKSAKVIPGDKIISTVGAGGNSGSDGGDSSIKIYRNDILVYKLTVKGGSKGENAQQAVITSKTSAKAGKGGGGGSLNSAETSPALNMWVKGYKIYPEKTADAKGKDGASAEAWNIWADKMPGGNGGINSKISPKVSSNANISQGVPCGGLSIESVKINENTEWECKNEDSIVPFVLTKAILSDFDYDYTLNPPGGSTGGGGGGWMYHTDGTNNTSLGAKGLDGYVYVYYGEWGKTAE